MLWAIATLSLCRQRLQPLQQEINASSLSNMLRKLHSCLFLPLIGCLLLGNAYAGLPPGIRLPKWRNVKHKTSLKTLLGLQSGSLQVRPSKAELEQTPHLDHNITSKPIEKDTKVISYADQMQQLQNWNQEIQEIRQAMTEAKESLEETLYQMRGKSVEVALEQEEEDEEQEMKPNLVPPEEFVKQILLEQQQEQTVTVNSHMTQFGRKVASNLQLTWVTSQLSGWDTCAIVSVVTMMLSVYFWDQRHNVYYMGDDHPLRQYLAVAMDLLFEGLNYAGIVSGLHGTVLFSLLSINGRMALGSPPSPRQRLQQNSRNAFDEYFQRTKEYRNQGLWSVRISVFLLGIQAIVFLHSQMGSAETLQQWAGIVILTVGFWKILQEVQTTLSSTS